jgi:hypothetical protein
LRLWRHFLDCSAPGGRSLQLHVHALIRNFDSCNSMYESCDVLSCLITFTLKFYYSKDHFPLMCIMHFIPSVMCQICSLFQKTMRVTVSTYTRFTSGYERVSVIRVLSHTYPGRWKFDSCTAIKYVFGLYLDLLRPNPTGRTPARIAGSG